MIFENKRKNEKKKSHKFYHEEDHISHVMNS